MILDTNNNWHSPVRSIQARVELYKGSALATTYSAQNALKSFTVERVGDENKFFGYGICQKLNTHFIDKDRNLNITTENSLKAYSSTGEDFITSLPTFYVTEVHRDENTNELSVTAYDALYNASEHTVAEIQENLLPIYNLDSIAFECANLLGLNSLVKIGVSSNEFDETAFETWYGSANLEGTETIREVLDAIAEATQTIYYVDNYNNLVFKQLNMSGNAILTISKDDYITLNSKTNRRLSAICSATELGDNVTATLEQSGSTQYVRDNPFWDLRDDIDVLIEEALARVGGLTINQFDCSWRGNFALEIGDKIDLVTKDNNVVTSYVLNDVITYDGGLSQNTSWSYTDSAESESNPSTLGAALKQTFARVDKVNKEIELVVSDVEGYNEKISKIEVTTDSITTSVSQLDDNMNDLISEVNSKVTPEDVTISIENVIKQGVDKVTTATGFTFNEDGLHISKNNSEITTSITEDGMVINKENAEVLRADNEGVKAIDLHATTYLIIGKNSRFEDYNSNRTGCFWIGG